MVRIYLGLLFLLFVGTSAQAEQYYSPELQRTLEGLHESGDDDANTINYVTERERGQQAAFEVGGTIVFGAATAAALAYGIYSSGNEECARCFSTIADGDRRDVAHKQSTAPGLLAVPEKQQSHETRP